MDHRPVSTSAKSPAARGVSDHCARRLGRVVMACFKTRQTSRDAPRHRHRVTRANDSSETASFAKSRSGLRTSRCYGESPAPLNGSGSEHLLCARTHTSKTSTSRPASPRSSPPSPFKSLRFTAVTAAPQGMRSNSMSVIDVGTGTCRHATNWDASPPRCCALCGAPTGVAQPIRNVIEARGMS